MPSKQQLLRAKKQKKYQETVHVVDRNGRVMDYAETSTPISDFSKSLPRNFYN